MFDPESVAPPGAKIKVVGVGGGGGNAVNTMIRCGLDGVDFVTCNTDVQALRFSLAPHKLQIGKELTRGLGAGADPDIGRDAALEDRHEIQDILTGADMVFITAGMGGGTGTGGASVVAQIARELGALTVAVVTKPFGFEGKKRRKHAEIGISRLRECVDTLITIPNQRLLQVAAPDLSMIDAFKMADEVLVNAVRGISDIINIPGMVNVDFADVKTVMSCMGQALMGVGSASGQTRAVEAAREAICSPLLEDIDIEGATGILVNITAGPGVTLHEINEACGVIQEAAHEDANFIFGTVIDEELGDAIRVTVIATGFPVDKDEHDGDMRPSQSIVTPYATRLTSPGLTTSPKPITRPNPSMQHYAPLTSRKPEPQRTEAPKPVLTKDVVETKWAAEPVRETEKAATPVEKAEASVVAPKHVEPVVSAARPEIAPAAPAQAPLPAETSAVEPSPAVAAPSTEVEPVKEPAQEPLIDAADEAQALARWTLGEDSGFDYEADMAIPALGLASFTSDDEPMDELASEVGEEPSLNLGETQVEVPQAPEPEMVEAEDEFADALASPVSDVTLAETIFESGLEDGAIQEIQDIQTGQVDPAVEVKMTTTAAPRPEVEARAGAVKASSAPLETFFVNPDDSITSDIDRKIDEALELAERMRGQPESRDENDDLDVPAFLRNGMKDLPLD